MAVPNIFGSATSAIPLSQLDTNFATPVTIGNTAVQLGNTVTSFGNVTLTNVTISSGNVTVSAGSNTAPSITTVGDTNTGIFFPVADTIAFTEGGVESMRIDSSGNLGINTSTPTEKLYVQGQIYSNNGSANNFLTINGDGAIQAGVQFRANGSGPYTQIYFDNLTNNTVYKNLASGGHLFFNNTTQAMTLDASGNLLVGTTSGVPNGGFNIQPNGFGTGQSVFDVGHANGTPSDTAFERYIYNNGIVGSITQNGTTGVLYNITSDYRLKNNQQPLTGAKDFVMALQPKKWQWWDGSGEGVGFVAHEFMEVAKYSGNGEKDAVDADGKPVYQSIQPSSSEVMANLVAHIQNLETRLAALESN